MMGSTYTISWAHDHDEGRIERVQPDELGAVVAAVIRDKGGYHRTVSVRESSESARRALPGREGALART